MTVSWAIPRSITAQYLERNAVLRSSLSLKWDF